MTHIFEVRDAALPEREPLATVRGYDVAMRAVAALQEEFWAQLDANGEGGRHIRWSLQVIELGPGRTELVRATSVASG